MFTHIRLENCDRIRIVESFVAYPQSPQCATTVGALAVSRVAFSVTPTAIYLFVSNPLRFPGRFSIRLAPYTYEVSINPSVNSQRFLFHQALRERQLINKEKCGWRFRSGRGVLGVVKCCEKTIDKWVVVGLAVSARCPLGWFFSLGLRAAFHFVSGRFLYGAMRSGYGWRGESR